MTKANENEIWESTLCLDQEETVNRAIYSKLASFEYTQTDHLRVWKRNDQTVIACLVDDIVSCGTDYHSDLPYLYDTKTTVITDNYLTCPSQYKVHRIPDEFLGIYSYTPKNQLWKPDRDYSFSVNRMDHRRFILMLDLAWRSHLESGYVNFKIGRAHV